MKFGICMNYKQALEDYPRFADYFEIAAWDLTDMDVDGEEFLAIKNAVDEGRIKT